MIKHITRMAGILLAFGFFISCTNTQYFQTAKLNLSQQDYSQALSSINKAIRKNPYNAEAYYYKGYILNKIASDKKDPYQTKHIYSEMRDALMQAKNLFKHQHPKNKDYYKIDDILTDSWSKEHNLGVKILKKDSTLNKKELTKSLQYLNNATTILPDSAITYEVKSEVYYRLGNLSKAVMAMETAVSKSDTHTKQNLDRLAFLYLEDQQYNHAIDTYKEALESDPGNINLLHGLENAYLANGDHQQAISLITNLLSKNPKNADYHRAYGTQLYSEGEGCLNKLMKIRKEIMKYVNRNGNQSNGKFKTLTDTANALEDRAQKYFNNAEKQLKKSQSSDSTNINTTYDLGILYHDYAVAYLKMEKYIPDKKLAELYRGRVQRLLKESVPYMQKVAKNQPKNPSYWKILYKIYSQLGMKTKADSAYVRFQRDS